MGNEFALELAKGIEELSIDVGISREMLTKQAIILLRRQSKDIDILQDIEDTKKKVEAANSKFNNAVDNADLEEAILEITEAETRLSALRRLAKENNIKAPAIEIVGCAERK